MLCDSCAVIGSAALTSHDVSPFPTTSPPRAVHSHPRHPSALSWLSATSTGVSMASVSDFSRLPLARYPWERDAAACRCLLLLAANPCLPCTTFSAHLCVSREPPEDIRRVVRRGGNIFGHARCRCQHPVQDAEHCSDKVCLSAGTPVFGVFPYHHSRLSIPPRHQAHPTHTHASLPTPHGAFPPPLLVVR